MEKNVEIFFPPLHFQKVILQGGVFLFGKTDYEKAKTLGIFPSFSGKVGDAQFHKCPVILPPHLLGALS